MQKWEYGVFAIKVTLGTFGLNEESRWQGQMVNSKFRDFLNQVGKDGWELTTSQVAVGGDGVTTWEYIFKRPIG